MFQKIKTFQITQLFQAAECFKLCYHVIEFISKNPNFTIQTCASSISSNQTNLDQKVHPHARLVLRFTFTFPDLSIFQPPDCTSKLR